MTNATKFTNFIQLPTAKATNKLLICFTNKKWRPHYYTLPDYSIIFINQVLFARQWTATQQQTTATQPSKVIRENI